MVRHGFAIESFKMGKKLDPITAREITNWTNFVMSGQLLTAPSQPAQVEQLPTIEVEDEYPQDEIIRPENIPF